MKPSNAEDDRNGKGRSPAPRRRRQRLYALMIALGSIPFLILSAEIRDQCPLLSGTLGTVSVMVFFFFLMDSLQSK